MISSSESIMSIIKVIPLDGEISNLMTQWLLLLKDLVRPTLLSTWNTSISF